jgi:death on curing protein
MYDYLSIADILGMHKILLKTYGGAEGIRDMGALESALYRPQSGYYEDIIEEASALMESLAINHPFIDGNKRVAFAAVDVFLQINGWKIFQSSSEVYATMIYMFEQNQFDYAHLVPLHSDYDSLRSGSFPVSSLG